MLFKAKVACAHSCITLPSTSCAFLHTLICTTYFRIHNSRVNAELVIRILMMGEKRKSRQIKIKKKHQLKLIMNFLLPNYAYKNTKIPARSTKKFCKNKNVLKKLCKLGQISSRFANNLRRVKKKKQKTKVRTLETL